MKAAIFTIGNEILSGKILNTNSQYLSTQLNLYGIEVIKHVAVEDDKQIIVDTLKNLLEEVSLIITTGGLGPTYDDITIESIAEALNVKTVCYPEILKEIEKKLSLRHSKIRENHKDQAYFLDNSIILSNDYGIAPGMFYKKDDKYIFALPGPPSENIPMFESYVIPELKKLKKESINIKDVVIFGISETKIEDMIDSNIEKKDSIRIATYIKPRYVIIRITSKRVEDIEKMVTKLNELFGTSIIGYDDANLETILVKKLMETNLTISLAESCTGGMISSIIVNVPGASNILNSSLVTYSNAAKIKLLGVKKETLDQYGAVSEKIAKEMVEGLYDICSSDICVSITGIAGPDYNIKEKPVGLTYIALKYKDKIDIFKYNFVGDRNMIRYMATLTVLNVIRLELIKNNLNF